MRTVALLLMLSGAGCQAAYAAPPATTQSATTQSVELRSLKFADAVPLRRLRKQDNDIDLRNQITLADKTTIYFGQVDTLDENDETTATYPILVAKRGAQWLALDFTDRRIKNAEFLFVASG